MARRAFLESNAGNSRTSSEALSDSSESTNGPSSPIGPIASGQENEDAYRLLEGDGRGGVPLDIDQEVLDKVERVARTTAISVVRHESHVGPMPSPRDFALYDKVLPGTAEAIRDQFVLNAAHVREMERLALQSHKDDNDKNRSSAERLMWGALIASFILALMGYQVVAGILAASSVGAIAAGFLKAKWLKDERAQAGRASRKSDDGADDES